MVRVRREGVEDAAEVLEVLFSRVTKDEDVIHIGGCEVPLSPSSAIDMARWKVGGGISETRTA